MKHILTAPLRPVTIFFAPCINYPIIFFLFSFVVISTRYSFLVLLFVCLFFFLYVQFVWLFVMFYFLLWCFIVLCPYLSLFVDTKNFLDYQKYLYHIKLMSYKRLVNARFSLKFNHQHRLAEKLACFT